MEKLIGYFDTKKARRQFRVYTVNSNGKTSLSMRMYSYRAGDWCLTKKGVAVPRMQVYKLTKLLEKAAESIAEGKLQIAITP